jgi:hypothetical protein
MELDEFISLARQRYRILTNLDLNGMAVIDDAERRRTIVELDRLQIDLDAVLDVDR